MIAENAALCQPPYPDRARQQSATLRGALAYDLDPTHDPRVVEAVLAGADAEAVNALVRQVAAEMTPTKMTSHQAVGAAHRRDETERAGRDREAAAKAAAGGFTQQSGFSAQYTRPAPPDPWDSRARAAADAQLAGRADYPGAYAKEQT